MSSIHTHEREKFKSMLGSIKFNILLKEKFDNIYYIKKLMRRNKNRTKWFGYVKVPDMTFEEAFNTVIHHFGVVNTFNSSPKREREQRLDRLSKIEKLLEYSSNYEDIIELSKEDIDFLDTWYKKDFKMPPEKEVFDELFSKIEHNVNDNVEREVCETCDGYGYVYDNGDFLTGKKVVCPVCNGKKYK